MLKQVQEWMARQSEWVQCAIIAVLLLLVFACLGGCAANPYQWTDEQKQTQGASAQTAAQQQRMAEILVGGSPCAVQPELRFAGVKCDPASILFACGRNKSPRCHELALEGCARQQTGVRK